MTPLSIIDESFFKYSKNSWPLSLSKLALIAAGEDDYEEEDDDDDDEKDDIYAGKLETIFLVKSGVIVSPRHPASTFVCRS